VAQLERQKQGIHRFASTGVHDILERLPINIENWCKIGLSIWYFLCAIGNALKTCHDARGGRRSGRQARPKSAEDRARSQGQHRRRVAVAHEVYGPNNQVNVDADGAVGDGTGALSNRNRRIALQALAFQLGWAGCYRNGTTGWFRDTYKTRRSFWLPDFALTR
jgi:hypothetical protein